jgi:hypothetical protein
VYRLADFAEEHEECLAELELFATAWQPECGKHFDEWSDRTSLTESHEYAKFYFLLLFLDTLEVRFPKGPPVDRVQVEIDNLKKRTGSATVVTRMWAARFLADMGPEAVRAVDALTTATRDPEPVVRAWAFDALSSIEQNPATYRVQIEHLIKEARKREDDSELDIQSALDDLDRSLEDRWLSRLRGSAIENDVELVQSMAARVDVNKSDRDNQTPPRPRGRQQSSRSRSDLIGGGCRSESTGRVGRQHNASYRGYEKRWRSPNRYASESRGRSDDDEF